MRTSPGAWLVLQPVLQDDNVRSLGRAREDGFDQLGAFLVAIRVDPVGFRGEAVVHKRLRERAVGAALGCGAAYRARRFPRERVRPVIGATRDGRP